MQPPNPWGDRRRRCVGLLGGSFNPAHEGHRHIALLALSLLRLDQVWLMVSPQNPLKAAAGMGSASQRLASVRAVTRGHPRLAATDIEASLGTRFTADTIDRLRRRFPNVTFVWVMGADNLVQMARWARWRRIFSAVPVAILDRSPYSRTAMAAKVALRMAPFRVGAARARGLTAKAPPAWVYLHTRLHPASATAIRAGTYPVSTAVGTLEHKEPGYTTST